MSLAFLGLRRRRRELGAEDESVGGRGRLLGSPEVRTEALVGIILAREIDG